MKTVRTNILRSCLAAFALTSTTYAVNVGYNADPGGANWNRGEANTAFSLWDAFPSWQFTNAAPLNTSGFSISGLSQTQAFVDAVQGGGLYNILSGSPVADRDADLDIPGTNGDILFGGANPVNFLLTGTVSFTIRGVVLQVRRPGNNTTMASTAGFLPTISINGGAPISFDQSFVIGGTNDPAADGAPGNAFGITSFVWNDSIASLLQGGSNSFTITAAKGTVFGNGPTGGISRGIDGFSVDVASVVPEPASAAILAAGCGMLGMLRRRRTDNARA